MNTEKYSWKNCFHTFHTNLHYFVCKYCCLEALHLNTVQRTRRSRKTRMALKQTSQKVAPKFKLNSTDSAKQNITYKLSQNNTKEMTSLLLLNVNVTQSQIHTNSSKDLQKPGEVSTDAELVQNNMARSKNKTDRKSHMKTTTENRRHRIKTDTDAQRTESECAECGESPHIGGPLRGERVPIPRTDEAAWAAAAVGFLLVLLTLSVLHTRLYRHCRPSTSLYWQDGQRDYENVGGKYTVISSCFVDSSDSHQRCLMLQTSSGGDSGWLAGGRGGAAITGDRKERYCPTPAMRRILSD